MINKLFSSASNLGFSKTAKNIYWVFFGNFASIIITFFTTIIIANAISKEDNGIFLALFTLANLLSELGEAGVGSALSHFVPRALTDGRSDEATKYVASGFRIELGIGLTLFLVVSLLSPVLSRYLFASTPVSNVLLIGIMTVFLIAYVFASFALSAYQRFREVAVLNIFYSLVRLLILFLVMLTTHLSLGTLLVVYLAAAIVTCGYGAMLLKPAFITTSVSGERIKKVMGFAGFLAVQKILVAVSSRLDLLMLVPLSGALEAGVYGIASRFAMVYPVLIGSLGQVLAPKFAEYKKGSHALAFFKKVTVVVVLLLVSQFIFYIFAQPLLLLLVPKYADAIPVFQSLLVAMVGFVIATPFVSFLIYTLKKPYITTLTSATQLIIIFLSNVYFLPSLGRMGPAIGIGLGNMAVCIIAITATVYYLRKEV